MSIYRMVVRINAAPGCEEEFDRWYDGEHLAHVMAVPGFRSCQRYRVVHAHGGQRFGHCTIFEIDTDDVGAVMAELQARAADGRMPLSPALDPRVEFEILEPAVVPSRATVPA